MARRSDHSPSELRALFLRSGHALVAEKGLVAFSAREAARRSGYTVGMLYHVFGSLDAYVVAINTVTMQTWTGWLEEVLGACPPGEDRIEALVRAYFGFASANTNAWLAIYDHRRPADVAPQEADVAERVKLTGIVDREVAKALDREIDAEVKRLARSLIATVHGHCVLHLSGNFALMNEADPLSQAVARVRESLLSNRQTGG